MKAGPLSQITVTTSMEAQEPVAALLERLFAASPSIYEDMETHQAKVTLYSKRTPQQLRSRKREILHGLNDLREFGLDLGRHEILIRRVPRVDWSESWKKYFKTIRIGKALLIKPGWARVKPLKGQAVVVLDPGLSFGTGQHATTSFCLKEMVRFRQAPEAQSFLDIGTGSGILAIAAGKLGYAPVEGFDFDPVAVRVAQANCRRNRVQNRVKVRRQDLTKLKEVSRKKYDLICANLISTLLLDERDKILNRLAPEGRLVLAGILASEFELVAHGYQSAGLELIRSAREREWQSGSFRFRTPSHR